MADPLKKRCGCGTLVWDVPHPSALPRKLAVVGGLRGFVRDGETIICGTCQRDHSRRAFVGIRILAAVVRARRRFWHWRQRVRKWWIERSYPELRRTSSNEG